MIVLLLTLVAGATLLVYAAVGSAYLALLGGTGGSSMGIAWAVGLCGLALGSRIAGPVADRSRQPLALFGAGQLLIGLYAFFFEVFFRGVDRVLPDLDGRWSTGGWSLGSQITAAVVLLWGPAILMGTALPLMGGWLQQRYLDPGRRMARLYSAHCLGAAIGAGLAGLILIPRVGFGISARLAAGASLIVGLSALVLSRFPALAAQGGTAGVGQRAPGDADEAGSVIGAACGIAAVAGGAALGLQVMLGRVLVLTVGASGQAVAVVLMTFALGWGIAAGIVASPGFRRLSWGPTTVGLLLAAALWIGLLLVGLEPWMEGYRKLRTGLAQTEAGYWTHQALVGALGLVTLGIPAALIGAVLPLSLRLLGGESGEVGRRTSRLLTWTALGSVAGGLVSAWALMPLLGLRDGLLAVALVVALVGVLLALAGGHPVVATLGLVIAIGVFFGAWRATGDWQTLLSSGRSELRERQADPDWFQVRRKAVRLEFYRDAPGATVSVESVAGPTTAFGVRVLRINGHAVASTAEDRARQILTGQVPLMSHPDARSVLLLGLGNGVTAGALLQHPIERLVVAEPLAPLLTAASSFKAFNADALADPRVRIENRDGRWVLRRAQAPFDLILSDSGLPWITGAGGMFSQDFFALCAERLVPGGCLAVRLPLARLDDDLVRRILRTVQTSFPVTEIWDLGRDNVLLLASRQPWPTGTNRFRIGWERPGARAQLQTVGIGSPESLWARQCASQDTAWAIAGPGPVQTDRRPFLEYDSARSFFVGGSPRLLCERDERQWPYPLAPKEKRDVLARLPQPVVTGVFEPAGSLLEVVSNHVQTHSPEPDPAHGHPVPCIFRPQEWEATPVRLPDDASDESHRLAAIRQQIRANGDDWSRAVAEVMVILRARPTPAGPPSADFPLEALARDAATAALRHGEAAFATEILREADRLHASDDALDYLRRLAERHSPETRRP